jgi:predicted small lipoprotein YifL
MRHSSSLAVGLLLLSLSACGPKGPSSQSLPSRDVPINPGAGPLPPQGKLAECTRIGDGGTGLSGQLSTHYANGVLVKDRINMNVKAIPNAMKSSNKFYFQIFRWTDNQTSGFQINTLPTRMFFVNKITGQNLGGTNIDRISKRVIEDALTSSGITNITMSNFFDYYYIVLTGVDFTWKAVKFAYYNLDLGTNAIGSTDALLPPFTPDPNAYALTNTNNLLVLHPNYQYMLSGATQADFYRLTEDICREFFSSVRLPASVKEISLWTQIQTFFTGLYSKILSLSKKPATKK